MALFGFTVDQWAWMLMGGALLGCAIAVVHGLVGKR